MTDDQLYELTDEEAAEARDLSTASRAIDETLATQRSDGRARTTPARRDRIAYVAEGRPPDADPKETE